MCSGERPTGAAKGKQTNTMASCQPPPPLPQRVDEEDPAVCVPLPIVCAREGASRAVRFQPDWRQTMETINLAQKRS